MKRYDGSRDTPPVLEGINIEISKGAFLTLLGPSGCGKSTLLNIIAGLDNPTTGTLELNGKTVFDSNTGKKVTPDKRNISMVFQSYAIWPHMTVRENVEFPIRCGSNSSKMTAGERKRVVDYALERVGLSKLADRPAPLLSGGQQQRVSLARALAQRPSLMLLDEPLSNLDAHLREKMQKEIRSIVTEEGITAVYVTHDQKEALSMSDVIAVLNEGKVQQFGTPMDIYYRPKNRFVAQFMGWPNLINATVKEVEPNTGQLVVDSPVGLMTLLPDTQAERVTKHDRIVVVMKQEDLRLIHPDQRNGEVNSFAWPIVRQTFLGDRLETICKAGGANISVYASARQWQNDDTAHVAISPNQLHYFLDNNS